MPRTFFLVPEITDADRRELQRRLLVSTFCAMFTVPPSYVNVWECDQEHIHVDIREIGSYVMEIGSDDNEYRFRNVSMPDVMITFPI